MYNGGEGGGVLDNFIKLVVGDRAAFQLLQVLLFSPSFSVGVYGMGRDGAESRYYVTFHGNGNVVGRTDR